MNFDTWHEYAIEYGDGEHLTFALDGVVYQTLTTNTTSDPITSTPQLVEFYDDMPFFIILNTAIGGPWPAPPNASTVFPTYHRIDYVRISQPADD